MTHTGALISMFVAGLAGSLHCVGMCGPILVGFSQVFGAAELTVEGRPRSTRPSLALDFAAYHVGRIWTYAMLGLLAGTLGAEARDAASYLGWQRTVGIAVGVVIVLTGVVMLAPPGLLSSRLWSKCASQSFAGRRWFDALVQSRGVTARLLLGVIMGLLPCGLVYAMLVLAAAMHDPLLGALGMIAFGIATVPSLTAVLLTVRFLPARLRVHGTRLAAVLIIATGAWMTTRAVMSDTATGSCPHCVQKQ